MSGKLVVTKDLLKLFLSERGIALQGNIEDKINKITNIKPIDIADKNDAAFCRFDGDKGLKYIQNTNAGLIFIPQSMENSLNEENKILLLCEFPRLEMLKFILKFWKEEKYNLNLKNNSSIHESSIISDNAVIGPFTVIGPGVIIGPGSCIGANCHIENTSIGSKVEIASGVSIGGNGFGFEDDIESGVSLQFPHIGGVHIGDNVSIGSNTCIDRGSIGDTIIEDNVKIDNLCHIAHNVYVGEGSKIIALSMIGGSVHIGSNSWISPSSTIRDWRKIGKNTLVGLGAVVVKDVEDGEVVIGNPAKPFKKIINRYK